MLENELFRLLTNLGEKLTNEEAKYSLRNSLTPLMMTVSFPSSPSLRRCAQPRSKKLAYSHQMRIRTPLVDHPCKLWSSGSRKSEEKKSRSLGSLLNKIRRNMELKSSIVSRILHTCRFVSIIGLNIVKS